jgi:hypothetical protein
MQAPTAPKKRSSIRVKISRSDPSLIARPPQAHREGAVISDSFINSKKDKLSIKRNAFVSRIEKAHKKPLKRRRPNKKLVATLEGLADVLPDVDELVHGQGQNGKIKTKSLKSKPGAMKRKERLERTERERFGKNMAQIMALKEPICQIQAGGSSPVTTITTTSRFAALRAWADANMEKHPGFGKMNE